MLRWSLLAALLAGGCNAPPAAPHMRPQPRPPVKQPANPKAVLAPSDTTPPPPPVPPYTFPSNFQFGSAIAGFQVEMGCPTYSASYCEDRNSDWYTFITNPLLVHNPILWQSGQPPTMGPGFYELYNQDLNRAATELSNNALRVSIEWSRLFPRSTVGIVGNVALRAAADPDALAYYHSLFSGMLGRGLKPFVTINHYTLPSWLHDTVFCNLANLNCNHRGWLDHDIILREIEKYAGFVANEYGAEVDDWATLNEPFTAVVIAGYVFPSGTRSNPPGVYLQINAAKQVAATMVEAHARIYDAVHANDYYAADGGIDPARVGIVYNVTWTEPQDPNNPRDVQSAADADYFLNRMFLNGVAFGDLDQNWDGNTVHRDDLANRLDFLGVNYYNVMKVSALPAPVLTWVSPFLTFNPATPQDFTHPENIYDVLLESAQFGVPLLVSETGVDDTTGNLGEGWVVRTLAGTQRAIDYGLNVRGYFYWSLMDNYEWNHGTNMHFGLYAVDGNDHWKTRNARSSAIAYGRIAAGQAIPADLISLYLN